MVHLFGLNLIVYAAAVLAAFVGLSAANVEFVDAARQALLVAGALQLASLAIIYFAWRYIPGFSYFVFPNVSGDWTGRLEFTRDGISHALDATMHVQQNIMSMSLLLGTIDAESDTIMVHPKRLSNGRFELHYIYETRKRVGRPPPFYKYRGTAEIRVMDRAKLLTGSYYTEQGGTGTFTMKRKEY